MDADAGGESKGPEGFWGRRRGDEMNDSQRRTDGSSVFPPSLFPASIRPSSPLTAIRLPILDFSSALPSLLSAVPSSSVLFLSVSRHG